MATTPTSERQNLGDDIPPLEDMTELLEQVKGIQQTKQEKPMQSSSVSRKSPKSPHTKQAHTVTVSPKEIRSSEKSNPGTFMGMKKGFLLSGPEVRKDSRQEPHKPDDDIPLIKPKEDGGQTDEMFRTISQLKGGDWMTSDFVNKLDSRPHLKALLSEPKFTSMLRDWEKNPGSCSEALQSNPELRDQFMEFCGLIGGHFSSLAKETPSTGTTTNTQPGLYTGDLGGIRTREEPGAEISVRSSTNPAQPTAQDEARMKEILSDPEVAEAFGDTRIRTLVLETIRKDPQQAQKIVQAASPEMKRKIQKLVDVGLLAFQT